MWGADGIMVIIGIGGFMDFRDSCMDLGVRVMEEIITILVAIIIP